MNLHGKSTNISKNIFYVVICILLINPVTIFLLTKNIYVSILIPLFLTSIFCFLIFHFGKGRIVIYYFNLIFFVSIAYHAELVFSTNYSEYNIPNLYNIHGSVYFNKPSLNQIFNDEEYISEYITNIQGFRISSALDPSVKIDSCDWLFVGDSFTQGAQVNYEDLFTSKLYKVFPDKIIVNAGISGYSLVDYYNYYVNEGYKLKPKKVFVQICIFNDFMKVEPTKIGLSEYLMQISNLYRFIKYNLIYQTSDELPLKRWSEPFYPDKKENIDYNIFYTENSEQKAKDIKEFEKYLIKLNQAVCSNGSEMIILLIPTKEQVYYKYFEEVISNFHIDITKLNMNFPNEMVLSLAERNKIKMIDYYLPFINENNELFFKKDEHLNTDGHNIISKGITDFFYDEANNYNYLSHQNNSSRYPNYFNQYNNVVYQGFYRGRFQIFISDSLINNEELLLSKNIDQIHPIISKDGKYLAYTLGDQEKGKTNIVLYNLITNKEEIITELDNEYGAIPNFSFSGDYLIYPCWHEVDNKLGNPFIVLYNIDTKEKLQLTDDIKECWRPIFHPNDSTIFFISKDSNNKFILESINIHHGNRRIVLDTGFNIWDPCISNDGKRVSFAGFKNGNWDLFLLDIDSNKTTQLTKTIGNEWDPSFGENGNKLIFAGTFGFNNGIYSMILPK